ncbi:SH3 domain-containing protein [Anaerosacchariphilus polymeriproducens]|uniref:Spore cortex-lytic protein n=1 Tax=Anaerosacchariphilus polymeriproducens TaxID=1812858 RepID=A0A371AX90_9FIRM|nr:cell wall hydrolase [Anaerosacchariphilus polymeriproducens]RDU24195.1 spore cortex-lytic protein [Anaerosacchariphilus polymeriproducens]
MNFNRKVIECGAVATLMVALTMSNGPQTIPTVAKEVTETKTVTQEILFSSSYSAQPVELKEKIVETAATETTQKNIAGTTKVGVLAHLETGSTVNDKQAAEKKKSSGKEKKEKQKQKEEKPSPWDNKVMAKVDEYTNIRAEQNAESELLGKLYKGSAGEIIEAGDEWTKIRSGSVEGYVKNDFLAFGKDAETLANEQCELIATVNTTTLNVRKESKEDAQIVGQAAEGETLSVADKNDKWVTVNYKDETAYVSADFVNVEQKVGQAVSIEEERELERQKAEEEKAKKEEEAKNSSDVAMLAAIIQCEAGSECYEGKVAVGAVVMNRLRNGYAGSVEGVITQPGQFTPVASGAFASVLASGASGDCYSAALEAYTGTDNVGGATSFRRASSGYGGQVIGNHVFF